MRLVKKSGWLEIIAEFDVDLISKYKEIPHYSFKKEKHGGVWRWPCNPDNYYSILTKFPHIEKQEGLEGYIHNLDDGINRLPQIKEMEDIVIDDYDFKTPPRPYQRVAFEFLRSGQRTLLLDPMGTGKTKDMIDYTNWLFQKGYIDKCLIFGLKSILYNWVKELHKHSWIMDHVVVEGTPSKRLKLLNEKHKYYIMNWECVRNKKLLEKLTSMAEKKCCILGDEVQKIKNHASQTSRFFRKLYSWYMVLATGTLTSRIGHDAFSALNSVSLKWKTWTDFANEFCVRGYWGGWELSKSKNEELRDIIGKYSLKRSKKLLLPQLPDKVYEIRHVELGKVAKKAYSDMAKDFIARIDDMEVISWNVLTQLLRLTEISSGFLRNDGEAIWIDSSKLDACHEIVEEVVDANNDKIIIWAKYIPTIDKLMERYGKSPYNAVFIDGRITDAKERMDIVNSFQQDRGIKVFIGQMQSAGVGIDLFSMVEGMDCCVAVRLEQDWSPITMRQLEDRIHRDGQTSSSVTIIDILCRGCLGEYILKVVEKKEKMEHELVPMIDVINKTELMEYL